MNSSKIIPISSRVNAWPNPQKDPMSEDILRLFVWLRMLVTAITWSASSACFNPRINPKLKAVTNSQEKKVMKKKSKKKYLRIVV